MFKVFGAMALAVLLVTGTALAQGGEKAEQGQAAIMAWLALVDAGDYAASWDETAPLFKNIVPKEEWVKQLTKFRTPMGKVLERKDTKGDYTRALPGAPKGEYVVMHAKTTFENRKDSVESVTAMLSPDGKWRICGFYIQ